MFALLAETACQRAVAAAESGSGKGRVPECDKNGKFVPKQCDDKICWCVKPRKGRPAYKKQKVPLDHPYDCKSRVMLSAIVFC